MYLTPHMYQFGSVQSLSHVWLFAAPWITAHQASLSITNSGSSLKCMSIELVMPSSHLILCHPLPLLPPISPCIRVFSNVSTLRMRWPKYWSFSFSIIASKEIPAYLTQAQILVLRGLRTLLLLNKREKRLEVWIHTVYGDWHSWHMNGLAFGDSLEGSACLLRRKPVSTSHLPGYIHLPSMC